MSKTEYLQSAQEAYDSGRVSAEAYDAMLQNADVFCDKKEDNDEER